jgi:hypothetical protein
MTERHRDRMIERQRDTYTRKEKDNEIHRQEKTIQRDIVTGRENDREA